MKNKKLLILVCALVLLVGATAYLYIDDILKLFGIGAPEEIVVQQPVGLPADNMQPEVILSKAIQKMNGLSLKSNGYPENMEMKGVKGKTTFNIVLPDNIINSFPKEFHHYKELNFVGDFKADMSSYKFGLGIQTPFTKNIFAVLSDAEIKLIFPESNLIFEFKPEDIPNTLKNNMTLKEAFYLVNSTPEKLKELFEITKIEENAASVKLSMKPLKQLASENTEFQMRQETQFKVNKKNFLVTSLETIVTYQNQNIPTQSTLIELHYNEDNSLILKADISNTFFKDKKLELLYSYKNGIYSDAKIRVGENEYGTIKYELDETPKVVGMSYENEFFGAKVNVAVTDILITQSGLEDFEFAPEGSEDFEVKSFADLTAAFGTKEGAQELLLKKDTVKFFEVAQPLIMNAVAGAMQEKAKSMTQEAASSENAEDDSDDADDDGEEDSANKSEKKVEVAQVQPAAPPAQKQEIKKEAPKAAAAPQPAKASEADDDDDDEADDEEEEKPTPAKPAVSTPAPQPAKKEPVKEQPVQKTQTKPARQTQPEPDYQPKPRSAQFTEIVRHYNSKKIEQTQILTQLQDLLKNEQSNVEALYMAGYISYQQKNMKDAANYFDMVLKAADINDKFERQILYWSRMMKKSIPADN